MGGQNGKIVQRAVSPACGQGFLSAHKGFCTEKSG